MNLPPAATAVPPADPSPPAPPAPSGRGVLAGIMSAVLLWGLLLALGSFLFDWNPLKPLIVTACVAAFLTVWLLALLSRRRSLDRRMKSSQEDL